MSEPTEFSGETAEKLPSVTTPSVTASSQKKKTYLFKPSGFTRDVGIALGFVLFTLLFRFIYNWNEVGDWPDVATYWKQGQYLIHRELMEANNVMPLFPMMFALSGFEGVETLNMWFHALTAGVAFLAGRSLFGSWTASIFAGTAVAMSPQLNFYSNLKLTEVPYAFFLTTAIAFIAYKRAIPASIFLTLGTLIRPLVDIVALVLIMFSAKKLSWKSVARSLLIYLGVYVLLMTPWWIHNYEKYGKFVQLNYGSGSVVRLENSDSFMSTGFNHATMYDALQPYFEISDLEQRDSKMRQDAVDWVMGNPVQFGYWTFDRVVRYFDLRAGYNWGIDLWFQIFGTLIYILATGAIFMLPMEIHKRLLPIYLTIAFVTAVTIVTHSVARYRIPIEPLLYLVAGGGLTQLLERFHNSAWPTLQELLRKRSSRPR
jgi:hypothetical protein